jgi:hypothetical protein
VAHVPTVFAHVVCTPAHVPAAVHVSLTVLMLKSSHVWPTFAVLAQIDTQHVAVLQFTPGVQVSAAFGVVNCGHVTFVLEHVAGMPWQTPAETQTSLMVVGLVSLHQAPLLLPVQAGWQHVASVHVLRVTHAVPVWSRVPPEHVTPAAPHVVGVPANSTCKQIEDRQ